MQKQEKETKKDSGRVIRFRAWDQEMKFMHQAFWIGNLFGQVRPVVHQTSDSSEVTLGAAREDLVLMQYTGLKDKNGKEVYESDYVDTPDGAREVVWNQLHLSWGLWLHGGQTEHMLADWINDDGSAPKEWEDKSLEVIGNKYENPELLK